MSGNPQPPPAELTWSDERIPPGVGQALVGPDGPFRLTVEPVLGTSMTVFARRPRSLRDMLDGSVGDLLDLPFLVAEGREWTYREALRDIDATAVLLARSYGVRPGDRVAIVAANCPEYGIVVWALLSLGAVVTSLNGWWTPPEMHSGLALAGPSLLVGDQRRLDNVPAEAIPHDVPVRLLTDLVAEAAPHRGARPERPEIDEDAPAVILFTSGTTGRSKGATLSHRNIVNFAMTVAFGSAVGAAMMPAGMPRPDRPATILTSPMFHVSGLVAILVSGVVLRSKLVFARTGAWDPAHHVALTEQHRITTWSGVPTQFWRLLRDSTLAERDLSSIMAIGAGGALFPPELVRALHERFPRAHLGNGYGMSETVGLGTLAGGELFVHHPDAVGSVPPTSEVQIRDPGTGDVVACGEVGEIHLRSPSVFLGYWDDSAADAAVLDADRWYRTGDFGRIENGMLYLEGRRRDMILRGGENVYPIEIENRLVAHPAIDDAAVIGIDDAEFGQQVKAFVVRSEGSALDVDDVRAWCSEALARFKVPAEIEFRDALPYSATGKLLKTVLEAEEAAHRVPAAPGASALA